LTLILTRIFGGKSHIIKHILPLIPKHRVFVEVFGGGASLLLNKEPSDVEVYNDINEELVNLFRVVKERPNEFYHAFDLILYSRKVREDLQQSEIPTDPLDRAVRYWYLLNTSFCGDVYGGFSGAGCREKNEAKAFFNRLGNVFKVAQRLRNVVIENLDFRRLIPMYDSTDTFFWCDPPYFELTEDYYEFRFDVSDHLSLCRILAEAKGKWLLIYNDCPEIRALYSDFSILKLKLQKDAGKPDELRSRGKFNYVLIGNYF